MVRRTGRRAQTGAMHPSWVWAVERATGPAAELHARPFPDPASRTVAFLEPSRPAIVVGSAQPDSDVDGAAALAAGVDVARRRSGGGAVLVRPGALVWADVVLPAGDPLWDDDVGRAFLWLGDAWAEALRLLGVEADVHRGGLLRTPWGRRVCFATCGPGEVTVGGRKVVGISQRRTRAACLFQSAALLAWEPGEVLALLAIDERERAEGAQVLAGTAAGLGLRAADVERAFLAALPGDVRAAGVSA